ncbi:MAG: hypothetical protein IT424_02450 [Pirellulales bacterium]|nr:hypothetical protein [Pirellulales bacterium]
MTASIARLLKALPMGFTPTIRPAAVRRWATVYLLTAGGAMGGEPASLYDRTVFFDSSAASGGYYHSEASVVPPSELEIVGGKAPVETGRYLSPPNGLRVKWRSGRGGDWRLSINVATRYGRRFDFAGDTLSIAVYSDAPLAEDDAPRLGVRDSRGHGLPDVPLLKLHGPLPAGQWVALRFPIARFAGQYGGTREDEFDPRHLSTIVLAQGLDDRQEHLLYIDDIRVVRADEPADDEPPPAPEGVAVEGAERHFDVAWKPVAAADLLAYRIYRSWDGQQYEAIATRPGHATRAVDFVGASGKRAQYKVSAVDAHNNESPLSDAAGGETRALDDHELLDMVQRACFRFYWEAANEPSGMALEILPGDEDLVAVGASGFGIMAQLVATERQFIARGQSAERMLRIVRFLKAADRFHGAWPHFLYGSTGRVNPYFGAYDDGGDLVETAFLVQGLLAARQYFTADSPQEREIRETITELWRGVEWDWYRKTPDGPVLYWHWSPEHQWHISHPLIGWNETMIAYLLAIASPAHAVPAELWHTGWAGQSEQAIAYRRNWSRTAEGDHFTNGNAYYGIKLEVGCGAGGDLFFTQFSNLGFDPRGKRDQYTNYFRNNRQLALINRAYCIENPLNRTGYGPDCWGRSAGINSGGGKPNARDDNGTICSSAALGCMPYAPAESLAALKHFYRDLGGRTWGAYGFHDGFNETENWFDEVYMGLNQAQIVVGIENHRTGLLWRLFMANPEIAPALEAIGFVPDEDE